MRLHGSAAAGGSLLAVVVLFGWAGPVAAGGGDTFVVRATGNGGDVNPGDDVCDADPLLGQQRCTLRAAIEEANADIDEDRIEFRIGGPNAIGAKVINVGAPGLPEISAPLAIDGYSQPDSRPNTAVQGTNARIRIVLDGPGTGTEERGIKAIATVDIRGLAIRDFFYAIWVDGSATGDADFSVVAGNFLGTDVPGTAPRPNRYGVGVQYADGVRIGGTSRADRNLISGNFGGIYFYHVDGLRIEGNLIGVAADGVSDLGQTVGIEPDDFSTSVLVGGSAAGAGNVIAHSEEVGILAFDHLSDLSIRILRTLFFDNAGRAIDWGDDGVTPNDGSGDPDLVPNGLQNFPVITSARNISGTTRVRGTLLTKPDQQYRLEFFSNAAAVRQARTYLGSLTLTTDALGGAQWSFQPANKVKLGRYIVATATDIAAGQTSEISAPRKVVQP